MNNLLQVLAIAISVITYSSGVQAQQARDEMVKTARQCIFTDKIINSVYSGNCMIPMGPSGRTFKFLETDYNNMGGSAISDVKVEPSFSINLFQEKNSKKNLLLFNKTIGRDGVHAIFLVLDIVQIPMLQPSKRLMWGDCKLNGIHNSEILAVAKQEDIKELKTIFKAWRANKQSGKFEPMSVENVSCEQECVGDECD
jgi:hypothetical protein